MSVAAIVALTEALLNVAPEVVNIIKEFTGEDKTIPAAQVPAALAKMASTAQNSLDSQNNTNPPASSDSHV